MAKKRRKFSPQFKVDAVMDLLTGAKSKSEICREKNITEQLLYRWKNELLEGLPTLFEQGKADQAESSQRIAELERMVGRLALENEVLKNAEGWREAQRARNGR